MNRIKSIWLYTILMLCLSVVVVISWDDFFWSGSSGLSQLKNHFSGYNGRYLGNLVVMGITRSPILRIVLYTLTNVGIAVMLSKLFSDQINMRYIVLVLLTIPVDIFRQTFGWFSGFANYNVSTLLILIIFYLMLKADYKWYLNILMLILSFAVQFFAENVSIGNVLLSFVALVVCLFINRKKAFLAASWLVGSVTGFLLMYQNIAYHSDTSRSVSNVYFSEFFKHLLQDWSELVIKQNVLLILLFSVVIFIVLHKPKVIGGYLLFFNIYLLGRDYLNIYYSMEPLYMLLGELLLIFIFAGILVYTGIKVLDKEDRVIYFSFLLSGIIYVAPFLIVTPFGPRNILLTYLMLSVCLGLLWQKVRIQLNVGKLDKYVKGAIICLAGFWLSLYSINSYENQRRINQIEVAYQKGEESVRVRRLPFNFLGQGLDDNFQEGDRVMEFKEYYQIPAEIEIILVNRTLPLPWRQTNN